MVLLDPAGPGQRLLHSAGPNSPRHGSKTKDSVFIRQEFPSLEHDIKGYMCYFISLYFEACYKNRKGRGIA